MGLSREMRSGVARWGLDYDEAVVHSVIAMALTSRQMISRRTERFRFIDLTTIDRELRIEFEVPPGAPTLHDTDALLLPLGLHKQDVALRFLRAECDGNEISILTKEENERLATRIDQVIRELGNEIATETIRALTRGPGSYLMAAIIKHESRMPYRYLTVRHEERLAEGSGNRSHDRSASSRLSKSERTHLGPSEGSDGRSADVCKLIDVVRKNASVLPRESTMKTGIQHLRSRIEDSELAAETMVIEAALSSLHDASSTHIEIEAPEELEVRDAFIAWLDRPTDEGRGSGTTEDENAVLDAVRFDPAVDLGPRAHLHATRAWTKRSRSARYAETLRGRPGLLVMGLAPRTRGLRMAGVFISLLSAFVLLVCGIALLSLDVVAFTSWHPQSEALVAALVFAPSVAAAIVAQPGRHEIASRLLEATRRKIALAGVLPVGAAALLAAGVGEAMVGVVAVVASLVAGWVALRLWLGASAASGNDWDPLPFNVDNEGAPSPYALSLDQGSRGIAEARRHSENPEQHSVQPHETRSVEPEAQRRFLRLLSSSSIIPGRRSGGPRRGRLRVLDSTEAFRRPLDQALEPKGSTGSDAPEGFIVSDELLEIIAYDFAEAAGWAIEPGAEEWRPEGWGRVDDDVGAGDWAAG